MKTYLVEIDGVSCIVKARSKFDAAEIVAEEFHIYYVSSDHVKKLPKKGVVYNIGGNQ